jgi:hypothetical protein
MAIDVYWLREFEAVHLAFMAPPHAGERLADETPGPLLVMGDWHMSLLSLM